MVALFSIVRAKDWLAWVELANGSCFVKKDYHVLCKDQRSNVLDDSYPWQLCGNCHYHSRLLHFYER